MAATKPSTKNSRAKSAKRPVPTKIESAPRRIRPPKYRSFRLAKRYKRPVKLANSFNIAKKALGLLWQHKKFLLVLVLIYGVLNIVFVRGFSGGADVSSLKDTLSQLFTGNWGNLFSGLTVFALLVTSSGNTSSDVAGAYQMVLVLLVSLAIVWSLRQFMLGSRIRVRDAFYQGMYPLVPVLLVLVVIGLQFLPLLVGSSLYGIVINNGIAVDGLERSLFALLYACLALLSLYMVSSSVFALYIATLPDMTPVKALKSARELVRFRRFSVLRKVLFLPILLLVSAAIVMIPIIIFLTPAAEWVFFVLTMFGIVIIHAYMYTLYRELLNE